MLSHRFITACIAAVLLGACDPTPDTAADASTGAVWTSDSTRFVLRVSGGLPPPRMPGACKPQNYEVTWDAATGRLALRGCYGSEALDTSAVLDAAGRAAVASLLASLAVAAERGCGVDYPDCTFVVTAASGARTYNSTYYAGCAGRALASPLIAGDALRGFGASLVHLLRTCAGGDSGVTCVDAGRGG